MHVLPLLPFALPTLAHEAGLPLTHVDRGAPFGFCIVAPAVFAGLNRAKVRT